MPFTKGRFESYYPHTDGTVYRMAVTSEFYSGTGTAAKVADGDYAIALGASDTSILVFDLPEILRTGEPHLEDSLAASAAQRPAYEQYNAGPTPFVIPSTNAQQTVPVVKGIKLTSVNLIYQISGAALTLNEAGVFLKSESNNAAASITTLVPLAANGLQTAIQTDRYVTNIPIPEANQLFPTTQNSLLTVEWDINTAVGGAANVFGVVFNFDFNYD
jgi:hypothetical protein